MSASVGSQTLSRGLTFLLFLACVYSPRLGEGSIANHLRLDDLMLPLYLLGAFLARRYLRPALPVATTLFVYQLWMAAVALAVHASSLLNGQITFIQKFLPVVKGLEFLVLFCFAFSAGRKLNALLWPRMALLIGIAFIPDIAFGLFQLWSGSFAGFYGVGIINEISATLTGAVFLFSMVWARINLSLMKSIVTRTLWIALYLSSFVLAAVSGSRAALVSGLVFIVAFESLAGSRKSIYTTAALATVSLVVLGAVLVRTDFGDLEGGILRFLSLLDIANEMQQAGSRGANWAAMMGFIGMAIRDVPFVLFTGLGVGATYAAFGEVMNAADSQYVFTFVSGGLFGMLLLGLAALQVVRMSVPLGRRGTDNRLYSGVTIAVLIAMAVFSATQEILILSKTGGLLFLTIGLALSQRLRLHREQPQQQPGATD